MADTCALVLAAGDGKRMRSGKNKVLHEVLFKPMIDWVLDAAQAAGAGELCVVAGHLHEQLEEHLGDAVPVVLQKERLGTGHAVMQAAAFLEKHCGGDVVVLCGDAPFITGEALVAAYTAHSSSANDVTVITARVQQPTGYGRIRRGEDGAVQAIVEERDATAEEKRMNEINSGAYWFRCETLLQTLSKLQNNNAQGEYYLTDAVRLIAENGGRAAAFDAGDPDVVLGANDRTQLLALNEKARLRVLRRLMADGVSVVCTDGVVVGADVTVGADTVLLPGSILRGKTVVGERCVIGPNSLVEDSVFGDDIKFNASQAYRSRVENGVTIGPFAHLRPDSVLREMVHVGDFVEIKNSTIGAGTKVPHLTYVGDSDVGEKVNFGCGCVTVNYDGVNKHRTVVGDHAFIGCNTNLVAPVRVGDNAYTAAGSTITHDVPADALAVARSRQENKEGWVARRRRKK